MHAKDNHYAKFFLFTEQEVEVLSWVLCQYQNQVWTVKAAADSAASTDCSSDSEPKPHSKTIYQ
jgi:hypothetical protein